MDKEDNPGKDAQALRKRYKSEKELSRSFEACERGETKYDEEERHTASLLHGYSFNIKKKGPVQNGKNYLWLKMKDKAKRRSESEYHNCVRRNDSKLTCFVKKYMKYFSDLKRRSYKTSSYGNGPNTRSGFGNRLGTMRSNPNFTAHMKKGRCNEGNFKYQCEESLSIGKILGRSFLHKVVDLFASPFRSLQERRPPNNSNHSSWNEVTPFLIFTNGPFEEAFMDKFYASLPFKMIVYSTYLHFAYNDVIVLFCFSLCVLVLSLCYEYRFERRGRASFLGKRESDENAYEGKNTSEGENTDEGKNTEEGGNTDEAKNTDEGGNTDEGENTDYEENGNEADRRKMPRHYMTKYFSIDNSTPTSPIEDILNNLKFLLDHMKKLEEDASEKKLSEIGKMREKIKMCENILRTQNLNEVQICKYRKFERVYNMWCLDKIENNYCEKNDECKSYLSQSLNRKSFNSFSNIHSLLSSKFQEQHNFSFEWKSDIEHLYKRNVFISIGYKLLYPLGVLEASFDKAKLKNFLLKMHSMYNEVPYHNSLHAAQVAHFSKSMLFLLDINHKIPAIDEFCLHVSSLCHDVGHPGLNNYFLINSENNLAITYNDNSVLENYHCSLVFKTLKEKNCNIFENYPYNIFTTCKKNIIRAILSTDMKNHFEYIANFRTSKEFIDLDILTSEQTWQIFSLILKAADIGHATLDWNKHYEWTIKINEEFYLQGLLEKSLNMPNSFLCDINSTDKLATSQIGFLKHLCIPLFSELNSISKNDEVYNHCISSIENNIEQWEKNKNNQKSLGLHEKYKDENLIDRIKLLKCV
ncbi:3',5'-cyclic-nucleotide phosphodiesterase [Plasmodium cynomolgi strain B]|uniref:Phosphodiesterase n=1 Tax=Plasmodium cynomolgi (strain B) TaxID=1120755 RepID=K6UEG4_PLACD|nr:3',5'-cyclic-nucleotide phosphodiesterase [Plasmodium cynomolgi strain B]GAB68306.1 3',5'-cyclic-nucleotide phosphodiesterase [Plasmodium cynomolgi strain B]